MSAAESAMSAEGRAKGGNSLESKLTAVRRYWWIVLAVVSLAVLAALLFTARTPTTYLGRTSLIVSSNDRSPEQDAVLVQGYVSYFNNGPYQQQLLAETGVDATASLSAQAAAASPILVISATAPDPDSAQSAAIAVAKAFKDDINKTHDQQTAAALATLRDELDTARARKDNQTVIAALRDQIRQLQADRDNVLQELQSRGGVSVQPPSLLSNLVLALAGGLVMGVLAALALARFSRRLCSRYDVADKVGLNTLVELPGTRTKGPQLQREQRLRQLTNILRARLAGPGVVAVTQATDGAATRVVARGLAMEWATQGYATVLVRLGGGMELLPSRIGEPTPVGLVEASAALSRMRAGPVPGMSILDMRPRLAGGTPRLPAMKVTELRELEQLVGAFIIIETPAVIDSADAQAASLAADVTILVIDTQVAKVPETREAIGVLRQPGVVLLGAVLAPVGDEEGNPDEGALDPDGGDIDEGNGRQPRSSGLDTWLLAPWASPTGSAWSWSPTSSESADSSKPDRSLPDDVTEPAQDGSLTLLPAPRPTGGSAPRRNGSISQSERSA